MFKVGDRNFLLVGRPTRQHPADEQCIGQCALGSLGNRSSDFQTHRESDRDFDAYRNKYRERNSDIYGYCDSNRHRNAWGPTTASW